MGVIVIPTKRCDLRCRHCMRSTFSSSYMDVDMHARFVEDVIKIGHKGTWDFTGGEPTLHPHLDVLIQEYIKRNLKVNIVSNAQLERGYETAIKNKKGVNFVRVSFDSPIKEFNDSVRGPGTFDAAVKGVQAYVKNGVRVVLGFVIHDENVELVEECFKLGQRLGVDGIAIWGNQQWVVGSESESRNKSLKWGKSIKWDESTTERYHKQLNIMNKYKPLFRSVAVSTKFNNPNPKPVWECQNYNVRLNVPLVERIVLLPDGLVSQCCDLYDVDYDKEKFETSPFNEEPISDTIGNYLEEPLEKILQRKKEMFIELSRRRQRDHAAGLLVGERANICTNCAYYHYEPRIKPKIKKTLFTIVQEK